MVIKACLRYQRYECYNNLFLMPFFVRDCTILDRFDNENLRFLFFFVRAMLYTWIFLSRATTTKTNMYVDIKEGNLVKRFKMIYLCIFC
jgi:hypothetical protein